jgi:hypothetical protein
MATPAASTSATTPAKSTSGVELAVRGSRVRDDDGDGALASF